MIGKAATILVSSVMTPSLSGTLKSTLINTFLLFNSMSLIVFFAMLILLSVLNLLFHYITYFCLFPQRKVSFVILNLICSDVFHLFYELCLHIVVRLFL